MDYGLFDPYYDSFLVVNSDLHIVYANEAAALLFGTSVRRLTNKKKTLTEIVEFSPALDYLDNVNEIDEPTAIREIDFTSSTGKVGKGQITVQLDRSNPGHWVMYIRDVTLEETLQKKYRAELDQKEEVIEDLKKARTELENYSRNLEDMVNERTEQVKNLHKLQTAMLDSLGQGFLVFDEDGACFPTFSKACNEILETSPSGLPIWQVLKLPEVEVDGFKKWCKAAFAEMLPFKDMAPLAPQTFSHSDDLHIQLEYHPMRVENRIEGIVLVASDVTQMVKAQREANKERAHAEMIVSVIRNKNQLASFVNDTRNCISELKKSTSAPDKDQLFRLVHTIKGGAASFSLTDMVELTHELESSLAKTDELSTELVEKIKSSTPEIENLLDNFVEQNSELLGPSVMDSQRYIEKPLSDFESFRDQIKDPEIQTQFTECFIYEPIHSGLRAYADTVEKTSQELNKECLPLQFSGENILINPDTYSDLFSSLVHCFRNAVDHGIETPDIREATGKPRAGRISVTTSRQDNHILIEIEDDGGGIDPSKLREKFEDRLEKESDEEVIQHIFDGQLSTKTEVTLYSGRGVGLDAVKTNVEKIGGTVRVESALTKGSKVTLKFPIQDWKTAKHLAA